MHDRVWYMVLVLGLVASLAGASLSFVHSQTAPIIEQRILDQKIKPSLQTMLRKLNVDNDYIADRVILDLGKDHQGRRRRASAFIARSDGQSVAVALQTTGNGYAGTISCLSVFDTTNRTILGVRALDQKETRGLGARIGNPEEPFIRQFSGMSIADPIQLRPNGGQVDAVSGATISSKGFTAAVEQARQLLIEKLADTSGLGAQ